MTNDLLWLWLPPVVVLAVAAGTVYFVLKNKVRIIRELDDVEPVVRALRDQSSHVPALAKLVRVHLVGRSAAGDDRLILSTPLSTIRREYAEEQMSRAYSFGLGSLLTGISLIITFALIAWVMTDDVSGAIRATSTVGTAGEAVADGAESSAFLADAVAKLGGKFAISAVGVAGSIVALLFTQRARKAILAKAEDPDVALLSAFTSLEAEEFSARLRELELLREERETRLEHHKQLCRALEKLDARMERLHSIEVSVKDIGNEVSANLKNIMKDAMGEQLADMLSQTMVEVERIASRVEHNLTDSFGKELQALSQQLRASLDTVRTTIEGQGQGQLEKILAKLQDTVSGGFQSESQKMAAALDGFAKVVPALEQQLRAMTGQVAEETRQRNEETARMTQQVLDRVSGLLDSLAAQQAANAEAVQRLQAASTQGAEEMARRIEASGASMVTNVLASSRAEIEAIVAQMRAAVESSASSYGDIEAKAANASAVVAKASEALEGSARSIFELTNQTRGVLEQVRQGSGAMQQAANGFLAAGNTLLSSVDAMRAVIDATRVQNQEQQRLLLQQQQFTKEVEQLWPTLFDTYLRKFQESADVLARSWDELHSKVEQVTSRMGHEFAENTLALSDAVSKLVEWTGKRAAR